MEAAPEIKQESLTTAFKRSPAVKLRVSDIGQGKWSGKYLELKNSEIVTRVRLLGTVVNKFLAEDKTFSSMTLDDSSDTIRIKTWDSVKTMENLAVGDVVDLIGKVREYNGEIYVVPEIVRKIDDPNFELLRRLELMKKFGFSQKSEENKENKIETPAEKKDVRKDVMTLIESSANGISYSEIVQKIKVPQTEIEFVINDFLSGGICYEPSPGVIKKI